MPSVDFMTFQAEDAIAVTVSTIWNIIILIINIMFCTSHKFKTLVSCFLSGNNEVQIS